MEFSFADLRPKDLEQLHVYHDDDRLHRVEKNSTTSTVLNTDLPQNRSAKRWNKVGVVTNVVNASKERLKASWNSRKSRSSSSNLVVATPKLQQMERLVRPTELKLQRNEVEMEERPKMAIKPSTATDDTPTDPSPLRQASGRDPMTTMVSAKQDEKEGNQEELPTEPSTSKSDLAPSAQPLHSQVSSKPQISAEAPVPTKATRQPMQVMMPKDPITSGKSIAIAKAVPTKPKALRVRNSLSRARVVASSTDDTTPSLAPMDASPKDPILEDSFVAADQDEKEGNSEESVMKSSIGNANLNLRTQAAPVPKKATRQPMQVMMPKDPITSGKSVAIAKAVPTKPKALRVRNSLSRARVNTSTTVNTTPSLAPMDASPKDPMTALSNQQRPPVVVGLNPNYLPSQ